MQRAREMQGGRGGQLGGQHVEQSSLAGTGGTHDGKQPARLGFAAHIVQKKSHLVYISLI